MGIGNLFRGIFGTNNDRKIKQLQPIVNKINALEPEMQAKSDDELRGQTDALRARLEAGESLDNLLPEAFATVREASVRALGMRPFDVQLMGGIVLHQGKIAEMRTGEGKTLMSTLPVYLNALTGRGVHVVTVNEYLATRDAEWMGKLYNFLGMSVGALISGMNEEAKRAAYQSDITYGTNNEFGFDYLRDNMKASLKDINQKDHYFAIIDEVDSILIDEARTPLIISGPTPDRSELYVTIDKLIPSLSDEDFQLDEKSRAATLTDEGVEKVEALLKEAGLLDADSTLYDPESTGLVHHVNQALIAHKVYRKDREYLMRNGEVMLVDEFTGRVMDGRRLSNGLHQAIEAKEGVKIHPENQTLASVTYQNYFRLYEKLAGMTGTAMTEAEEFGDIYKLDVVDIPTNRPVQRLDEDDRIYRTQAEKVAALLAEVKLAHEKGQATLIGTTSIEKSEMLSEALSQMNIPHNVLNARQHEQEAEIIAKAGRPGAVTIATNMAGRGTDIQLGGNVDAEINDALENAGEHADAKAIRESIKAQISGEKEKALSAGGLFVIGTERHESRRIDNQLRGRSGRQGDPGRTLFFLSLEDDLMRIFGSDRLDTMLKRMGLKEGEAMEHPWLNKALERAQRKVEGRNFDIRKNLLKFDDVMNEQRKVMFAQRMEVMEGDDLTEILTEMRHEVAEDIIDDNIPERAYVDEWDADGLKKDARTYLNIDLPVAEWFAEDGVEEDTILERINAASDALMDAKKAKYGEETMTQIERQILLRAYDDNWREHLEKLDHLRSVIGFRAHAQRDPLNEYKTEAFAMFEAMLETVRQQSAQNISRVELVSPEEQQRIIEEMRQEAEARQAAGARNVSTVSELEETTTERKKPVPTPIDEPAEWAQTGRNEPCPCGSGKKYKHCHGKVA